ncbi:MAG: hypothetical protein AB4040_04215 [Synechococcus sp.]
MKFSRRHAIPSHPKLQLALAARGYILVVSVLMMGVILLIGTAAGFLSLTNVIIAGNVEANLGTRYRAEAGVDAAIAYLQSQASGYLSTAEIDSEIAKANTLSIQGEASTCPFDPDTGVPCITVTRWTPETVVITAIAGDPSTNAEYVAEASIRLTPSTESMPPIGLLAEDTIEINGAMDLTGGTASPYDDLLAHGNNGYAIDSQATLPLVDGTVGITASPGASLCFGGGVAPCPADTIATQSIVGTDLEEVKTLAIGSDISEITDNDSDTENEFDTDQVSVTGNGSNSVLLNTNSTSPTTSLTSGSYITASQINSASRSSEVSSLLQTSSDSFTVIASSEDVVFPENTSLSDAKVILQSGSFRLPANSQFSDVVLIAEAGSIIFEGDNTTFTDSAAIASDGIDVLTAVTFSGTSLLASEGSLNKIRFQHDGITSTDDLSVISEGSIEFNANIPSFKAGLTATGDILFNGTIDFSGFAQSGASILLAQGTGSASAISSLVATEPEYRFGFVLSRN